jgi:hypothetical protein
MGQNRCSNLIPIGQGACRRAQGDFQENPEKRIFFRKEQPFFVSFAIFCLKSDDSRARWGRTDFFGLEVPAFEQKLTKPEPGTFVGPNTLRRGKGRHFASKYKPHIHKPRFFMGFFVSLKNLVSRPLPAAGSPMDQMFFRPGSANGAFHTSLGQRPRIRAAKKS